MSKIYVDEIAGIADANTVAIPGHVIQVVHNLSTSLTSLSTADTWTNANDFSVTITPSSADSLILIDFSFTYGNSGAASNTVRLTRNGTVIGLGANTAGNLLGNVYTAHGNAVQGMNTYKTLYEDEPSTTSAVTYQVQVQTSANTLYINSRNDGNTTDCQQFGYIAAWEIAG